MATSLGLREHSVRFSHSRGATAGKGRGTRVWRGTGQWKKRGSPQRPPSTCTPGKSRGVGAGKGATIASNSPTALELATVFVWGG